MTYRSWHTVRTRCEVIALDTRHLDTLGLVEAVVLTGGQRAALYLANADEYLELSMHLSGGTVLLPEDGLIRDLQTREPRHG